MKLRLSILALALVSACGDPAFAQSRTVSSVTGITVPLCRLGTAAPSVQRAYGLGTGKCGAGAQGAAPVDGALITVTDAVAKGDCDTLTGGSVKTQCIYNSAKSGSNKWESPSPEGGGSTVSVDGSEISDPDFVDDGDIDFSAVGSQISGSVKANSVALTTDTNGNYLAGAAGTSNEIAVSGSGSEGATATISLPSTIDLGGKTSLEIPNGASPTTDAVGEIAMDDNAWASGRGAALLFDGTGTTFLVGVLTSDTPANGQVPKWNTGGTITWETDSTAPADGDKGSITVSGSGTTWTIDDGAVVPGKLDGDFGAMTCIVGTCQFDAGAINVSTQITDGTVTLADMANLATDRLIGRLSSGTGAPEAVTIGGGLTKSGTTLQRDALTGDVTATAGSGTTAIASGAIVNADVNASAAIDATKLAYAGGTGTDAGTVEAALDEISTEKANTADIITSSQVFRTDADSAAADGTLSNWSAVNQSDTNEGIRLPQSATNCETNATAAGMLCFKTGGVLYIGNGTWADPVWGRPGAIYRARHNGSATASVTDFNMSGTGTPTFVFQAATSSTPTGALRATTNTGATDTAYISGSSGGNSMFYPNLGQVIFDTRVALSDLPDGTFEFRAGIVNLPTAIHSSTVGAFFLVDNTSAHWRVATGNGSLTTNSTTTAIVADQFYRLTIVCNPGWTSCAFYVDGVLAAGITNPVSTTFTTTAVNFGAQLRKISGSGQPYFDMDYEEFSYVLTTPQ